MSKTSPREWALAIGGGLALAAALLWFLRGSDAPPVVSAAPPVVSAAPAPRSIAPAPASTAPADLALTGLRAGPDGGMAIVASGGRQYLLRPGRALPGGMKLLRVEPGRAVLAGPGGELVLAFADAAAASTAAPPPPGGDPTPWQLALSPMRTAGRLTGWRLDNVAALPALARAGLKPGDVLLTANGNDLISEEKIMELPQELASNGRLQIIYQRGAARREAVVTR
jgi:type II secretory pathway component PulC